MIWILFLGTMSVSLWAVWRVKAVYNHYNQVEVASGLSGFDVVREILRKNAIDDVKIEIGEGLLGDHYDPIHKRLVLSEANFYGCTPAALGVAAHECGHAIQHAVAYKPLHWRMAAVGITTYANHVIMFLPLLGLFTGLITPRGGAIMMSIAWGVVMAFNLITLPVEFDASRRAKEALGGFGMIAPGEESEGVNKVLDAAAWTYVAAFITSFVYFLWHLLPLLLGGGKGRE